jgi:hypothetical protein
MKQFRGGVISVSAFEPDVKNSRQNFPAANSIKVSTLLSAYVSEEHEKRPKAGSTRQGSLKICAGDSPDVSLNFEPVNGHAADVISGKSQVSLCGLVAETVFPVEQHFEAHFYVWPSRDQPSWTDLFDRMRRNRQKMLVGFGDEKLGVVSATFDAVGILSVLTREDSSFYYLVTRLKNMSARCRDVIKLFCL